MERGVVVYTECESVRRVSSWIEMVVSRLHDRCATKIPLREATRSHDRWRAEDVS
jgi:hypothetical protein